MKEDTKELVIVMTRGIDSELSSVAFTLAKWRHHRGDAGPGLSDQRGSGCRPAQGP